MLKTQLYTSELVSPNNHSTLFNCEGVSNEKDSIHLGNLKTKVSCAFVRICSISVPVF